MQSIVENKVSTESRNEMDRLAAEISERRTKLRELRQSAYEIVNVKNYDFSVAGNENVNLESLFGDKSELMVVHNMGKKCSYCTLWADGFNGFVAHLENRAAFIVSSPDSPEVQQAMVKERGWKFKVVSTENNSFVKDMGMHSEKHGSWPGVSFFSKDSKGTITRLTKDFFGPGDDYCSIWHLFENFKSNSNDWQPKMNY